MSTGILERELKTYEKVKSTLETGSFVLIKGENVIGTYLTDRDALKRGYEEFAEEPFLVKEVSILDAPLCFTSSRLGV